MRNSIIEKSTVSLLLCLRVVDEDEVMQAHCRGPCLAKRCPSKTLCKLELSSLRLRHGRTRMRYVETPETATLSKTPLAIRYDFAVCETSEELMQKKTVAEVL